MTTLAAGGGDTGAWATVGVTRLVGMATEGP